MIARTALALMLLASLPQQVSAKRVPPQDECAWVEGADRFRMALATAIANRDADMLRPLVDPDVLLDFGGGSGWGLLAERLDDPDYALWDELDKVQRLGCGIFDEDRGGDMYMPYYWGVDPGTEDAFSTFFVIGSDVPLRQGRAPDSPLIDRLDWDVVTLLEEFTENPGAMAHVQFASGRKGFVAWDNLRSLVDYRLSIAPKGDSWQIVSFVAGD